MVKVNTASQAVPPAYHTRPLAKDKGCPKQKRAQLQQHHVMGDGVYVLFWLPEVGVANSSIAQLIYCPQSHLSMNDASDDRTGRPEIIHLTLKVSKTDPFRKGVTISVDRTGKPLCPVVAELAYLAVQGDQDGPLFQHHDRRSLTKATFVDQVRRTLTPAGVDDQNYTVHSFRIRAATTAATAGVDDSMIQKLGRWKSSVYLAYIRVLRERLAAISVKLADSVDIRQCICAGKVVLIPRASWDGHVSEVWGVRGMRTSLLGTVVWTISLGEVL